MFGHKTGHFHHPFLPVSLFSFLLFLLLRSTLRISFLLLLHIHIPFLSSFSFSFFHFIKTFEFTQKFPRQILPSLHSFFFFFFLQFFTINLSASGHTQHYAHSIWTCDIAFLLIFSPQILWSQNFPRPSESFFLFPYSIWEQTNYLYSIEIGDIAAPLSHSNSPSNLVSESP